MNVLLIGAGATVSWLKDNLKIINSPEKLIKFLEKFQIRMVYLLFLPLLD